MSQRKKDQERCQNCLMRNELCICTLIPRLDTNTKIIVIISKREFKVPTNTGRLAGLALKNSTILLRGDLDQPYDLTEHLGPSGTNFVFYPDEYAQVVTPDIASAAKPLTLIFPDGNWRGAGKMCRRDQVMAGLPKLRLPAGAPSNYRVRKETKAEGLATIEAISRALGIIESPTIQMQLDALLKVMSDRTLKSRGRIGSIIEKSDIQI
jgi:DTW domain-containing protein YfiP